MKNWFESFCYICIGDFSTEKEIRENIESWVSVAFGCTLSMYAGQYEYDDNYRIMVPKKDVQKFLFDTFALKDVGTINLDYKDGYYYIGGCDPGDTIPRFRCVEIKSGKCLVTVDLYDGENKKYGYYTFGVEPADNTNGFKIVSCQYEYTPS